MYYKNSVGRPRIKTPDRLASVVHACRRRTIDEHLWESQIWRRGDTLLVNAISSAISNVSLDESQPADILRLFQLITRWTACCHCFLSHGLPSEPGKWYTIGGEVLQIWRDAGIGRERCCNIRRRQSYAVTGAVTRRPQQWACRAYIWGHTHYIAT